MISTRRGSPRKTGSDDGARQAALRMLARRALSEGEIRARLAGTGYGAPGIEAAIAWLRDVALVDDRALCMSLAKAYRDARGYGRLKVARALAARRFPPDLVDEAVGRTAAGGAELAAAAAALRKKFGAKVPAGREGAAKAYRFLAGRGFLPQTCREAIRAAAFDIPEGEDETRE